MGVLLCGPVLRIYIAFPSDVILFSACPRLYKTPHVKRIGQNQPYGVSGPLLEFFPLLKVNMSVTAVCAGAVDLFFIQPDGNLFRILPLPIKPENFFYNVRSPLLRKQAFFPVNPFRSVPIRGDSAGIAALFPLCLLGAFYLDRYISGIHFVGQILQVYTQFIPLRSKAVKMVCNRNEPDPQKGEYFLDIIAGFYVISPESGKILHNNAVYLMQPHVRHQAVKALSLKVGARFTQIAVAVKQHHIRLQPQIIFCNFNLRLDRLIFFIVVVNGEPCVYAH